MSAWRNILTSQMIPETASSHSASAAQELLETMSCIAAIDMDCFYAQCEELRRPELKGKPVGVQQKNLVITSNYAARAFGIQKGDSLQTVREKCPEITICNGEDLTFYGQVSQQFFDVASRFSSKVEKLGLDEVFVDITDQIDERLRGPMPDVPMRCAVYPETEADVTKLNFDSTEIQCWKRLQVASLICYEIREAIQSEVGLTSSAGVSVSKLLAKMVASWKKPSQQTVFVPTASRLSSLLPNTLGIQKIPGIGFSSTQRCNALDIHNIGEFVSAADASIADRKHSLLTAFDLGTIKTMRWLCLGIDKSSIKASGAPKSCSVQDSFWQNPLRSFSSVKASLELLAKKLLSKVRSVEQNFGFRPVPTMSLTLRHAGDEPRRESRQMQLGSFKVGNPHSKVFKGGNMSKTDALPEMGTGCENGKDEPETLSVNDQLLSQQLAERAFGLFQKLVPTESFSLHILNIQINFSESVRGQQSLSFSSFKPVVGPVVDLDAETAEPTGQPAASQAGRSETAAEALTSLVAMGFQVDRAKRALEASNSSVTGAIEQLLCDKCDTKRPRTRNSVESVESVEPVELVEVD